MGGVSQNNTVYKVTIVLSSTGPEPAFNLEVTYDPDIEGADFAKIGYYPAVYEFMESVILPALDKGIMEWEINPMLRLEPPTPSRN